MNVTRRLAIAAGFLMRLVGALDVHARDLSRDEQVANDMQRASRQVVRTAPTDADRFETAHHVIATSTLVLYEWVRGPRTQEEIEDQESLLPAKDACVFGAAEAAAAAQLYRALRHARGRDMDIAIAACAIERGARLWTLNTDDFRDMPGLELYEPA